MPAINHDLDCDCGQPLDLVVASMSLHCPRCGRGVAPTCPSERDHGNRLLPSTVLAVAAA